MAYSVLAGVYFLYEFRVVRRVEDRLKRIYPEEFKKYEEFNKN